MSLHAGFAAALSISRSAAQKILHAGYVNALVPAKIKQTLKMPAAEFKFRFEVDIDWFLIEPEITSAFTDPELIEIRFEIMGTMTFRAEGQPTLTTEIFIDAKAGMPLTTVIQEEKKTLQFGLNPGGTKITDFQLELISGTDPESTYSFRLGGEKSHLRSALYTALISFKPEQFLISGPVLDQLLSVGYRFDTPSLNATKDSINIGIDVLGLTSGDAKQLVDLNTVKTEKGWKKIYTAITTGYDEDGWPLKEYGWTGSTRRPFGAHNSDLAISLNTAVLNDVYNRQGRSLVLEMYENQKHDDVVAAVRKIKGDVRKFKPSEAARTFLNEINIEFQDQIVKISGVASYYDTAKLTSDYSVTFRLVRTDVDGTTNFVNVNQNKVGITGEVVDVKIDTPDEVFWGEIVLGAGAVLLAPFTGGFSLVIGLILESVIMSTTESLLISAENSGKQSMNKPLSKFLNSAKIPFKLPNTMGPTFQITPHDAVVKPDSMTGWSDLIQDSPAAMIYLETPAASKAQLKKGTTPEPVWQAGDKRPLIVVFKDNGEVFNPKDETVRIRWSVFGNTTANLVQSKDVLIKPAVKLPGDTTEPEDPRRIVIQHAYGDLLKYDSFIVACRVYRTWHNGKIIELFQRSITIELSDLLMRFAPYVQWTHQVFYEGFSAKKKDPKRVRTGWVSVDRKSKIHKTNPFERCKYAGHYTKDLSRDSLTYLPKLPFEMKDLEKNRHLVCPYCFFPNPGMAKPLDFLIPT